MPTGALYQPFPCGACAAVAVALGAVESYLNCASPVPVLPAASVHDPPCVPAAVSGARYVSGNTQPATPLIASVPCVENVTGLLNQPLWSAGRSASTVTTGAVES